MYCGELMRIAKNDGTVDNTHPNDFGLAPTAQVLGDFMEKQIFLSRLSILFYKNNADILLRRRRV